MKKIRLRVDIDRLPTIMLYVSLGLAAVCLCGAAWFAYRNVYVPYTNETIPEDKLTQKQDRLNVKDFDTVRQTLDAKQKTPAETTAVDPFQARTP